MARTREDVDYMAKVVTAAVGQPADAGDINDGSGDQGFYIADKLVARLPKDTPLGQNSLVWEDGVDYKTVDEEEVKQATGWQPFQTVNTVAAREAAAENDEVQPEPTDDTSEGAAPDVAESEDGAEPTEDAATPEGEPETAETVDGETPKK